MEEKRTRILLVEDDADDAFLLREMLAEVPSAQFAIEQVERLDEALQRVGSEPFDVVLVDLSLPDSQGLATFTEIHKAAPDLPIVVLTGLDDETLAVKAVQEGAQDYLVKARVRGDLFIRLCYAIERQKASHYRALLVERERFDTAVSHMSDGIVVTDGDWRITTANHAACLLLNLPADDWRGRPLGDALAPFALSRPLAELQASGERVEAFEIARLHTQPPLYLDARLTGLRDPSGRLVSSVLMLRDVTDERRQREARASFVMMVSHKLRTPLSVLLACHDLVQRIPPDRMTADMPRITEMCSTELKRMVHIVQELLDFKVLSTTDLRAEAETADIAAAIARVTEQIAARYPLRPIEVAADVAPDAAHVACSTEHLELILGKLLDNAAKFADKERVRISVRAERVDDSWVRLSVSDDGPGIPHEYYDRIFDGFVQVEDIPTGQVPGLGVGLYIAQKVVQAYGGTITVHSQIGKGSTFTLTLPAA